MASFLNPHNICEYARGEALPCGPIGEPPAPEQCPPAPANLAPPENEPDSMTMMRKGYHASPTFPVGDFTAEKWRQLRWAYYRMIEKVDAEIGRVLRALRQAGLEEKTLIVFTADHGECAGAHGFNQKTVFYEESVRVPLIVSLKGVTKPGSSRQDGEHRSRHPADDARLHRHRAAEEADRPQSQATGPRRICAGVA